MVSYTKLIKSIQCACVGLQTSLREEQNFRLECLCAVVILLLSWFFRFSAIEFTIVIVTIGLVLGLELVNTAVEHLADVVDSTYNPTIKALKDVSAAGVLLACVTALAVGGILFAPHVMSLF